MSGTATPMYFSGTRASSESGEVGMYMQGGDFGSQGSFQQENGYGNQGQMYSIQEQSAYHQAYMHGQGDFQQPEVTTDLTQYQNQGTIDGSQGQQIDGNQWQQYAGGEGQQQTGNESQANWQQGELFISFTESNEFLARLDKVQEEVLYYCQRRHWPWRWRRRRR